MPDAVTPVASPPTNPTRVLDQAARDQLFQSLDSAARKSASPNEFYSFAQEQLRLLGYISISVYEVCEGSHGRAIWLDGTCLDCPHDEVLSAVHSGKPRAWRPNDSNPTVTSPTFIISPLQWNHQTFAFLLGTSDPIDSRQLTQHYPALAAFAEVLETFFTQQQQERFRLAAMRQTAVATFIGSIHRHLEPLQTAYVIANEGRRLLECERCAVALRRGSRFRIVSISGADHIHRHSSTAQQLEDLCNAICQVGEPFWYDGKPNDLPPQIQSALDAYLDASPVSALGIIPLVKTETDRQPSPIGAIVCEQFQGSFDPSLASTVDSIRLPCADALENAMEVAAIPGHRYWISLHRHAWIQRYGLRTMIAILGMILAFGVLWLVPADIRARATGELQPANRRAIFAPQDAVVTKVNVLHGDEVQDGQILLELRSTELDLQQQQIDGELDTMRKRLAAVQSERLQLRPGEADSRTRERRLTAEEDQLNRQVRALETRQSRLRLEFEQLSVRAPIAGQVLTWNTRERLDARPVKRGETLLLVGDVTGEWQVEVRVPGRLVGRFLDAQSASDSNRQAKVVLTTEIGTEIEGTVSRVATRAEADAQGDHFLLVTVDIPKDMISHRVSGTTAIVHLSCGKGSLGEAWFYELFDAIRLWMPMW